MQILLAITAICYALATFFRVREKVAGNCMKNHSRISIFAGIFTNSILLFMQAHQATQTSQLELNSFLITGALSIALCTIAIELVFKENYFSIFSLPVCLAVLLLSMLVSGKISGEHFSETWFIVHLITSIAGESFFMIAAISSATYLFVVRKLKNKNKLKAVFLFPPLTRLNDLTFKLIKAGALVFFFGLVLGLYGNYRYFNEFQPAAKHYFAGLVLFYYFIVALLRKPLKIAGPRLAMAAIIGFILSLILVFVPDNDLHWLHETKTTKREVTQ